MVEIEPAVRDFYRKVMLVLAEREVPFLVCGAFAMQHHVGFLRVTRDLDLMIAPEDLERVRDAMRDAGYRSDVPFPHWLCKIYDARTDLFVDVLWSSGNGISRVDAAFFEHAPSGELFDVPVLYCPIEEMIWSKAYVMERERFDGADVAHLLHEACERIDWQRLLERFAPHPNVLLSHLVLLELVYPEDHGRVPSAVRRELLRRYREGGGDESDPPCGGTLLSREQYLTDLALGRRDARLVEGTMSESEIARWTDAIRSRGAT